MGHSLYTAETAKEDWRREASRGRLWAVVDSCDEPSVVKKVAEAGPERAVSLYRGSAEEQYESIAPYLFKVDEPIFDWISGELWKSPWGIFAAAESSLEILRTHFRHYLTVKGTAGKKYLFRFYDPRVLPGFLRSCNAEELRDFFGPVRGYGIKKGEEVELIRQQTE